MRVWESRSPPAYRTTSDEPVSSEVVSILCVSLADFRRVLSLADFADFADFVRSSESSQISRISQILGCFLRKMRVQRGVFTVFSWEIRENVTFLS